MAIMDNFDRKILQTLQRNEGMSQRQIADSVGLSQNACWRRIKRLEDDGILRGSRARIDGRKLGLDLTIFVMIKTRYHSKEWSEKFRKHVADIEEVEAFYRIGGDWDYLLKVVTRGIGGYDKFYQRLIEGIEIESVTGVFSMETILEDRPLSI